ncbi:MAG: hypothetical protein II765_04345, partial [Lachnospiraceae bacterium]|nr:hypothetical protein [Lachnospiraceae bacterium]
MQSKYKFVRLNYQIAMMFIIVIMLVIGFIATMNTSLLGFYYIQEKASAMTDAYQQINQWYNNDNQGSIEFSLSMERLHANNNMAIVILESDGSTIYSTGKDNASNYGILMDAIVGTNLKGHDKIWLKNDNYTILRMEDDRLSEDYIVLWGTLDDGNLILLRSPLESMKESARISNKFFL